MGTTNYYNTFIAVAPDSAARCGIEPPGRPEKPSVAARTFRMIASAPYRHTSDDVIFTVYADRNGIAEADRPSAREQFFSKGQPCLRSSDLGKRYGWGIHSDADGRVALCAVDSPEYECFVSGTVPKTSAPGAADGSGSGGTVTVKYAMRVSRR